MAGRRRELGYCPAALYEASPPAEVRQVLHRLQFRHAQVRGSWLNPATPGFARTVLVESTDREDLGEQAVTDPMPQASVSRVLHETPQTDR